MPQQSLTRQKIEQQKSLVRLKLSNVHVQMLELRRMIASEASNLQTGDLSTEQKNWEAESVLHELINAEMSAQILEALLKSMV